MEVINVFALFISTPLLLIVSFLCCQLLMGVIFYSKLSNPLSGERKPVSILIPAHNESAIIKETLTHLMAQVRTHDKVIVVADNCDDNTDEIAAQFNVQVIVRNCTKNIGKGYALDFGIRHIENDPEEIVIILDADCNVQENTIDQLAIAANLYKSPVQSLYLMEAPEHSDFTQKIAQFAFLIKNKIRPSGLKALNLPCQLMGTGMAFPWHLISKADLANGNIVEDMKLGVDFIINGNNTRFIPSARITSDFPTDSLAQLTQRTRWEHGHLTTIKEHVPNLLMHAFKNHNLKCLFFALDLTIPPLTLLLTFMTVITALFFSISLISSNYTYFIIISTFFTSFAFCIFISWLSFGKSIITIKDSISIPKYIINKSIIYRNFLNKKEVKWIKTKRDK